MDNCCNGYTIDEIYMGKEEYADSSIKKEMEVKTEDDVILTDGIVEFTSTENDWENPYPCDKDQDSISKDTSNVDDSFQSGPPPIPDEKLKTVMKFLDRKSKSHPTGKSAREAMIAFHETGMSAAEIAKYFSVNAATVRRWIKRHKNQISLTDLPRSGRKRTNVLMEK